MMSQRDHIPDKYIQYIQFAVTINLLNLTIIAFCEQFTVQDHFTCFCITKKMHLNFDASKIAYMYVSFYT